MGLPDRPVESNVFNPPSEGIKIMAKSRHPHFSCSGINSTISVRRWLLGSTFAPVVLLLGGCVTDAEFLQQNSSSAMRAAETRGKFELNCQEVTSSVLSQKVVQGIQGGYRENCNAFSQTARVLDGPQ
ncbi:MAG: hypothetical protein H6R26_1040 [Proteobacteria bacterium]|nr:hypothetical protein [Pseudomonadota bacterium]